jgi:transposase InsO family protein
LLLVRVDKEAVRLFVVKNVCYQHKQTMVVVKLVEERFGLFVSPRTIRDWVSKFKTGEWDFKDKSRRPHKIHKKITPEIERHIVELRNSTQYDGYRLQTILEHFDITISESSVKRVLLKHSLSTGSLMKGKKLKYCRWQRDTPNSLWQLDHTEETDGTIRLPVIDDCSQYCFGIFHWPTITTKQITKTLDQLTKKYSKPNQILTDNGAIYQKQFDKWCNKKGIEHIHSHINKPTTCGKVEKIHDIYNREIAFWKTTERWRYQYNHMRPHRSLEGKTPAEIYHEFHRLLYYNPNPTQKLKETSGNMS